MDKYDREVLPKLRRFVGKFSDVVILKVRELSFKSEKIFSEIFDWESVMSRVFSDPKPWKAFSSKYAASNPLISSKYLIDAKESEEKTSSLFPVKSNSLICDTANGNSLGNFFKEMFCIQSTMRNLNRDSFNNSSASIALLDKSSM